MVHLRPITPPSLMHPHTPLPPAPQYFCACQTPFEHSPLLSATPDCRDLLRNNGNPKDIGTAEFHSFISAAPAEITRYEIEISRRQSALYEVVAAHVAILASYNACRAVVDSPIRKLSTEILTQIFQIAVPYSDYHFGASATRQPTCPLSRVCLRWHSIVMGTPALWSHLCVDLTPSPNVPAERRTKILDEMKSALDRGANHPLTSCIECGSAPRNETITFDCIHGWPTIALEGVIGRIPRLKNLAFNSRHRTGYHPPLLAFRDAPQLKQFKGSGPVDKIGILPWLRLETVILDCTADFTKGLGDLADVMSAISRLSSTQHFGIRCNFTKAMPSPISLASPLPPISSNVGALSIWIASRAEATDAAPHGRLLAEIFDCLTLPSVRVLVLVSNRGLAWPHAAFLRLSIRSSFSEHLISLDISQAVLEEHELLECLQGLPSLLRLTISDDLPPAVGPLRDENTFLITDSLLQRLTMNSDDATRASSCFSSSNDAVIAHRTRTRTSSTRKLRPVYGSSRHKGNFIPPSRGRISHFSKLPGRLIVNIYALYLAHSKDLLFGYWQLDSWALLFPFQAKLIYSTIEACVPFKPDRNLANLVQHKWR
ncbi:hypothetical protein B0H16DRAFT_1857350 [Mycena metata]|uniref:F-box domain-containing protein n=1 Tax=Mycena metata TaxID=1033252 RepID=A0AAD7IJK4_9AGAR|nr:hypothetical protein B0H16DRAFT_1857350 [Mycena metata]